MPAADPAGVLTGAHYLDGDHACCEGAIAAGCRFVAGYPITPSTEVVERMARRFPLIGGTFIMSGVAELLLDSERIPLEEGDCVYFDSSLKHRLLSRDGSEVRVLAVVAR